jgi:uncharacterized RDD family membrane protein YckC
VKGEIKNQRSRGVQGQRAGFVSQAVGAAFDAAAVLALYFAVLIAFGFLRFLVTDDPFTMPQPGPFVNFDLLLVIGVLVLWTSWSGSGRAPGMAVIGLRVVSDGGERLSSRRAFWRAVLSTLTLGIGVVAVLFSKQNRSLYDMVCGSAVVYAWRPRLPESRQNQ